MRIVLALLVIGSPLLAGCQKASAAGNDEMAHCIAGFFAGRAHFLNKSPPNYQVAHVLSIEALYYMQKLKASGVADGGEAEAVAFAEKNQNNFQVMDETVRSCSHKVTDDPDFRKHAATLEVLAFQADPICQADASRCNTH